MVAVSCLSLVSPLGYRPETTVAALNAGVDSFAALPFRDTAGEPLVGAALPDPPAEVTGRARLAALLTLLFEELDPAHRDGLAWETLPLLVCRKEETRPGADGAGLLDALPLGPDRRVIPPRIGYLQSGPVSGLTALRAARDAVTQHGFPGCLILAVDCITDPRTLAWLDAAGRLRTSTVTDGVMPGEGAALLLVSPQPMTPRALRLTGVGTGTEAATVLNDAPFLGLGLADALRGALTEAGRQMHEVDIRLADAAGESYAFEEVVLAQTRLMRKVRPEQPLWLPAAYMGDTGAAAGLMQLAWAEIAFASGLAEGGIAALQASSAFGARAAAIVEKMM